MKFIFLWCLRFAACDHYSFTEIRVICEYDIAVGNQVGYAPFMIFNFTRFLVYLQFMLISMDFLEQFFAILSLKNNVEMQKENFAFAQQNDSLRKQS